MIVLVLIVPLLFAALVYAGREVLMHRRDLSRLAPFTGGATVATAVAGLMLGDGSGVSERLSVPVAVLLALLTFILARRGPTVSEGAWGGPASSVSPSVVATRAGPSSAGAVAAALGRVEAREMSRSPLFGVGFGFSVLIFVLFGFVFVGEDTGTWDGQLQLSSWFAYPLTGMVVLAVHRAVTRAARDGADEFFDTCPTAPGTRTAGFLLTAFLPVIALAVFLGALLLAVEVNAAALYGPIGADSVADIAAAVTLGAGGAALGAALGRWIRFGLAPLVAVVAVGFAGIQLNVIGGSGWNPLVALSTAPALEGTPPMFADRPAWWHLLWIVGLTVLVGIAAVARHRRDRAVLIGGAVAAAVTLAAGIGATRPLPPPAAARIAAAVANPEADQACATAGAVEVCVYPIYRGALGPLMDRVAPIAAVLPDGLDPLVLRQVYADAVDELPPEVRRLLTDADLVRPEGELPVGFDGRFVEFAGSDLAYRVVGLPVEAGEDLLPTVVAGEARGVVALWLATRGLDRADTATASTSADSGSDDAFARGSPEEVDDPCNAPAVVWSAQDLAAARAVIALPERDVARVLHADWDRWLDPLTGSDELLAALALEPAGPFDHVEARPGNSC